MDYKPREYKVSTIIRDIEKPDGRSGKLYMDFANQRAFVWTAEQQSLFIHSILQGDLVPEIYILKDGITGLQPKTLLDGRQRVTTIYLYYTNSFKLHKNTPDITVAVAERDESGNIVYDENRKPKSTVKTYQIAGKLFKQLPTELQDTFLDFDMTTREMFDCTEADIARQMHKLNNGKAMTSAQRAITRLGITLGTEIKKITQNDFFNDRIVYKPGQIKSSEGMRCVLQSLIVYTGKNYTKLNDADLNRLAEDFSNEWSQGDLDRINELLLTANKLLPDNELIKDYLTVHNIPILIMNVEKYGSLLDDGDVTESQYKEFLKYWFTEGIRSALYVQYEGKSISSKANVEGRINIMEQALMKFINGEKLSMRLEYDKIHELVSEETFAEVNEPVENLLEDPDEQERYFASMLMLSSDKPIDYVTSGTIDSFVEYYNGLTEDRKEEILERAKNNGVDASILFEDANIPVDNEFVSADNIVAVARVYQMIDAREIDDITVSEWLSDFAEAYTENKRYKSVYDVVEKIKYLQTDLFKYKKNKAIEQIRGGIAA